MRKTLMGLGSALLLTALVLVLRDSSQSIAELWVSIDPNSLVGFGALIEKKVDPDLWTRFVLPLLKEPAWLAPLVPGILLLLAGRPWKRSSATDAEAESQTA
ncbi:MAG: hypothetical protein P8Q36_07485 [Alphaproteobacteria bacterium]|jgi:hypothetical protein|nr:hypothetical protein [Rhodospirillaceae bacterium]MDG2480695.1 hypothetical protein [Alphaproteobacteria bacterium]MBT6202179.1 hypothetical protein [Rhodospirillaceae bacterium]MBT6509246.1 hypothetical protein [Rhodospirillaceae bacterium]MBT7612433.1 hypothetical protein [Rhodospirillaceae bacterium]